jgi:hypothetical protein
MFIGCEKADEAIDSSKLVINELMAVNLTTAADQNREYDDWIEIYNLSNASIDLSGFYLTDSKKEPTKWTFPDSTIITANGYLIVWADKDTLQSGLHTNFKLSPAGEKLYLLATDLSIIDKVEYPVQDVEVSYARVPNGTGDFVWQTPTCNASNE